MYCSVLPCVSAFGGTGYNSAVSIKLIHAHRRHNQLLVCFGFIVLFAPGHGTETNGRDVNSVLPSGRFSIMQVPCSF